ncbi:MAG: carbon-nitrogen hydrolase family protein, partial [Epsilonproteobacteria bacterium]|nr:carbon-nitrogen hydrolase family protein [Campylobacterota bacterium]
MKKRAIVLQLQNVVPYDRNLKKILKYIKEAPSSSIIVAPEVSLTDYDYANLK